MLGSFVREIECLLNDNHQKRKTMIMIMKTSGLLFASCYCASIVDAPSTHGHQLSVCIYRALLQICRALLQICRALLRIYRALILASVGVHVLH